MPSGKGGSASQVTGYKYFMAVHFGLGRGPINELSEIRIGDIPAWTGSLTTSDFSSINKPDLFGGDQKEGGIVGTFKLFLGEATQTIDAVIKTNIEGGFPVPGWRGVSTVFYYGQISANNPYPKTWKFRVNRTTAGWDTAVFEPDMALIPMSSTPLTLITFTAQPRSGDTLIIGSTTIGFFTISAGGTNVQIGADVNATATEFTNMCNFNSTDLYDVTATVDGPNVTLAFPSPVLVNYGFGNFTAISNQGGSIKAMNAAHIIYECATNAVWGRGLPTSLIDTVSFKAAAQTLIDENFGLCIRWNRQEDIDVFVKMVVDHVGGAVFIHRQTGLLTFNLTRADYDPDTLTEFSFENGIIDITEDEISSSDTSYNEIIVTYQDPVANKQGSIRAQNLASFQSLRSVISTTVDYPGIPTGGLAARVAQRDLQINSADIRRMKIRFDRAAWWINPNDVFKISVPSRGIESMVVRALNIEEGTDQTITITVMQDIFGLPDTAFTTPQPSYWVPPDRTPRIIDTRLVDEMTYYDLAENFPPERLASMTADTNLTKIYAMQPTGSTLDYVVTSKTSLESNFVDRNISGFDATATLTAAIGLHDTDVEFENGNALNLVETGIPVLIVSADDPTIQEYARLDDFDALAGTATIARGCIDTIPHNFGIGDRIWFQTHMQTSDVRTYSTGEEIDIKLIPRTSSDRLDPSLAPTDTIEIGARQGRPYPPGKMLVDSIAFEDDQIVLGDVTLDWAHRDRIVEGNFLLEHDEASTGPEPGTTYTVRTYDADGTTLLHTDTGITGTTFTYDASTGVSDGDPNYVWFEVESVRDGLVSWQHYRFRVQRNEGFDYEFDFNFDGGA